MSFFNGLNVDSNRRGVEQLNNVEHKDDEKEEGSILYKSYNEHIMEWIGTLIEAYPVIITR